MEGGSGWNVVLSNFFNLFDVEQEYIVCQRSWKQVWKRVGVCGVGVCGSVRGSRCAGERRDNYANLDENPNIAGRNRFCVDNSTLDPCPSRNFSFSVSRDPSVSLPVASSTRIQHNVRSTRHSDHGREVQNVPSRGTVPAAAPPSALRRFLQTLRTGVLGPPPGALHQNVL